VGRVCPAVSTETRGQNQRPQSTQYSVTPGQPLSGSSGNKGFSELWGQISREFEVDSIESKSLLRYQTICLVEDSVIVTHRSECVSE
jgi:hypothetical protein